MLELPYIIIPLYTTGSVLIRIFLHLWYGGAWIIYHDVCILIFEKVPHTMIYETILGNLECWTLWDLNNKFIIILTVVGQ